MNFKRPKEEVIDRAAMAAYNELYTQLSQLSYHGANYQPGSVVSIFQNAISQAIRKSVESMVNDTYTDDEFEQDIGLK